MDRLDELEARSIYIIREAYNNFDDVAALWSAGKDSTTLAWLCKKAFFGDVPFPMIYIDTGYHFQRMYDFRDELADKWGLDILVAYNDEADEEGVGPDESLECCNLRKTEALKKVIDEECFDALFLGIRRDEHGIRAKERYYSPRDDEFQWDYEDQPPEMWGQYKTKKEEEEHIRVHPLLHWTEVDIWRYIKREDLPVNPLYFAEKRDGKMTRFRSLGCEPCTTPVESDITSVDEMIDEIKESEEGERSGRSQDKEQIMQKLRALGYMSVAGLGFLVGTII